MKKRGSKHERTIREFGFNGQRHPRREPLREFRGVLTGVPVYEGDTRHTCVRGRRSD